MNQPLTTNCQPPFADVEIVPAVCETHGACTARKIPNPFDGEPLVIKTCEQCKREREQSERESAERQAKRDAEWQAEDRRRRILQRHEHSGVRERFKLCTVGSYAASTPGQSRAKSICGAFVRTWQKNNGASLVLSGSVGTGKTHLACGIVNELIESHQIRAHVTTAAKMLRNIKSTYGKDAPQSEREVIGKYQDAELLVIDEIGVQVGSDHEINLLFEIIDERYQCKRPTILISNLNAGELEAFLGQRVMDRFRECGAVIAFDWESHRSAK